MRWLEKAALGLVATGGAVVLAVAGLGGEPSLGHPDFWLSALVLFGWFLIGSGAFLFARPHWRDHKLKRRAGELASRIKTWLDAQLADDPVPPGPPFDPSKARAHNKLYAEVGQRFRGAFPELQELNDELKREQINVKFSAFASPSGIRDTIQALRDFSERRGPLKRGD